MSSKGVINLAITLAWLIPSDHPAELAQLPGQTLRGANNLTFGIRHKIP